MKGIDTKQDLEVSDARYRDPVGAMDGRLAVVRQWLLLDANRDAIALGLLALSFAVTVLVGAFGPIPVERFLGRGVSPGQVFVELIKAIISIVVITLSINQLVLSPGLGPASEQHDRLESALSLRRGADDTADIDVSPSSPAAFLRVLVTAVGEDARALREQLSGTDDAELRRRTGDLVGRIVDDTAETGSALADARFAKFEVVPAVVRFNVSGKTRELRELRSDHEAALSHDDEKAFERLLDTLELFTVARAYLKTIYIRTEYINFSRALLYVGLPAVLVTYLATQLYDPGVFPGTTFDISNQLWFVAGVTTVALSPFALLISYVSRLATLSQSTLFVGPFVAGGADDGAGGQ